MRLLFAISLVSFCALFWAVLAVARHLRGVHQLLPDPGLRVGDPLLVTRFKRPFFEHGYVARPCAFAVRAIPPLPA